MIVRLARLPFVALRRLVVAVSLLTLGLCGVPLAVFVFWEDIAEEFTTGRRPTQFRGELQAELLDDYAGIFGVGHNSGGRSSPTGSVPGWAGSGRRCWPGSGTSCSGPGCEGRWRWRRR